MLDPSGYGSARDSTCWDRWRLAPAIEEGITCSA
jgi:hypothetical protein